MRFSSRTAGAALAAFYLLPSLASALPVANPDDWDNVVVTVLETVYVSYLDDTPTSTAAAADQDTTVYALPSTTYTADDAATTTTPTTTAAVATTPTTLSTVTSTSSSSSSSSSEETTTMVYADASTTYVIGIMDSTTTSYASDDSTAATTTSSSSTSTTATTTSSSSSSSSSTASSSSSSTIRGINVGGWLVLEQWLGGADDLWALASDAVDEYTLCDALGDDASAAMKSHWASWFTQDTVNTLASYGLNALRIPIGYWSFVDDASTISPYVYGAQDYLDQAIGWAQSAGMKVWVDLHGAPGSQNGYDNSGHEGTVDWQTGDGNINLTISVLTTMAAKYSGSDYADTVVAIELMNEPISWGNNDVEVTRQFYIDAYASARAALTDNQDLMIIMHDSFEDLSYWQDMPSTVGATSSTDGSSQQLLGIDTHRYQVFDDSQTSLDGDGHIENVCSQADEISASNDYMPTYVGEWSAAVNVCFFSNGSSAAGTSCDEDGCSCVTDDQSTWTSDVTEYVRKFVEAQMDVWEGKGSGYFFWSQAGPGLWNFINGVEQGWIPQPLTDREYPSQCGFSLSDMTESSSSKKMMHRRADEAIHVRRRRAAVAKREPHVLGAHLVEHLARQLS